MVKARRIGGLAVVLLVLVAGWLAVEAGSDDEDRVTAGDRPAPIDRDDLVRAGGAPSTTDPAEWQPLSEADANAAVVLVDQFVALAGGGDKDGAGELLDDVAVSYATNGAASFPGTDDAPLRRDAVESFVAQYWELLTGPSYRLTVTPGFGWTRPVPVVTVIGQGDEGELPQVAAFVVDRGEVGEEMQIRRLPSPWATAVPTPGETVHAGDTVVADICPLEGGVTVHVDGVEVPAQVATESCGPISFTMPATEPGEAIVTISSATPEELLATAFAYVAA